MAETDQTAAQLLASITGITMLARQLIDGVKAGDKRALDDLLRALHESL